MLREGGVERDLRRGAGRPEDVVMFTGLVEDLGTVAASTD